MTTTPLEDGFRMPGEWEPHEGCWLIWPENTYAWPFGCKPAQRVCAELANAVAETGEAVTVAVSEEQYFHARACLSARVRVLELSTCLGWARDIAPTFLVGPDGGRAGAVWRFNGYGRRSPMWQVDAHFARRVLEVERLPAHHAPIVAEGGGLHVDGQGTCLVTAETMLDPRRNRLTRDAIEETLAAYLGVRTTIWLEHGLVADETRGHIDNMACFAAPGVVLLAWTDDESDPQYPRSAAAFEHLRAQTDARGRRLEVVKVPLPGPLLLTEAEAGGFDRTGRMPPPAGTRLAASYCNFYLANGHAFVPLLDPERDEEVHAILAKALPDRTVVGIHSRDLLLGGGNLHCATQQVPARGGRLD